MFRKPEFGLVPSQKTLDSTEHSMISLVVAGVFSDTGHSGTEC